jgi:hypothetical protein
MQFSGRELAVELIVFPFLGYVEVFQKSVNCFPGELADILY